MFQITDSHAELPAVQFCVFDNLICAKSVDKERAYRHKAVSSGVKKGWWESIATLPGETNFPVVLQSFWSRTKCRKSDRYKARMTVHTIFLGVNTSLPEEDVRVSGSKDLLEPDVALRF